MCPGQQARVDPTGFSILPDAEYPAGDMTADSGGTPAGGPGKSAEHLALIKEIELKINEIKAIEARLGTPLEVAGDLERARELAHRINNLLTTFRLAGDFKSGVPEA
jgi:hypothetical protein